MFRAPLRHGSAQQALPHVRQCGPEHVAAKSLHKIKPKQPRANRGEALGGSIQSLGHGIERPWSDLDACQHQRVLGDPHRHRPQS